MLILPFFNLHFCENMFKLHIFCIYIEYNYILYFFLISLVAAIRTQNTR